MKYEDLSKEEFDAIVTGELTHRSLRMEAEINELITDFFVKEKGKKDDFKRLLLFRDGLTFQGKIDIVKGMTDIFDVSDDTKKFICK